MKKRNTLRRKVSKRFKRKKRVSKKRKLSGGTPTKIPRKKLEEEKAARKRQEQGRLAAEQAARERQEQGRLAAEREQQEQEQDALYARDMAAAKERQASERATKEKEWQEAFWAADPATADQREWERLERERRAQQTPAEQLKKKRDDRRKLHREAKQAQRDAEWGWERQEQERLAAERELKRMQGVQEQMAEEQKRKEAERDEWERRAAMGEKPPNIPVWDEDYYYELKVKSPADLIALTEDKSAKLPHEIKAIAKAEDIVSRIRRGKQGKWDLLYLAGHLSVLGPQWEEPTADAAAALAAQEAQWGGPN